MALICQSWFILKILRIWSRLAVADEFAYICIPLRQQYTNYMLWTGIFIGNQIAKHSLVPKNNTLDING